MELELALEGLSATSNLLRLLPTLMLWYLLIIGKLKTLYRGDRHQAKSSSKKPGQSYL